MAGKEVLPGSQPSEPLPSHPLPPVSAEVQIHELRLTVANPLGLHARPAARFVQTASRYPQAGLQVSNLTAGRGPVSARSITALATLGVRQGDAILVTAGGPEAGAALAALQALAAENFGDQGSPVPPAAPTNAMAEPAASLTGGLPGLPAAPGIAIGPLHHQRPPLPDIPGRTAADPQAEWEALLVALERTRAQIQANLGAASRRVGAYAAAIFEAHLLFLDDEALQEPAQTAIFVEKMNAATAWQKGFRRVAGQYRALEDSYLRARAG